MSWHAGCDQSHEQVDPEALDRSFFMRVCPLLSIISPLVSINPGYNITRMSSIDQWCDANSQVMAARSPNMRLQKAISRKNQRYGTDSIDLSWMLHLNSTVIDSDLYPGF